MRLGSQPVVGAPGRAPARARPPARRAIATRAERDDAQKTEGKDALLPLKLAEQLLTKEAGVGVIATAVVVGGAQALAKVRAFRTPHPLLHARGGGGGLALALVPSTLQQRGGRR
jgi:hypothetical protein